MLVPAAGAARRMRGADKLMEPMEGRPVLALMAGRARATGAEVLVTLPPAGAVHGAARRAALTEMDVAVREVPEAAEGMAASLRAGAAAAAGRDGLMVLLPDMPGIETDDIAGLLARFASLPEPRPILRAATATGTPGHPVVLPARLLPAVARLRGDTGARTLLDAEAPLIHPLPDDRATVDLDTPEAWAAWRAVRA